MEVSDNSTLRSRLVESLIAKNTVSFNKCLQESIIETEKKLVETYSSRIKESLNA